MDFALTDEQIEIRDLAARLFDDARDAGAAARDRGERRARASTASSGRRSPRPACSAWPSRRTRAVSASASSRRRRSWSRSGARWLRCRWCRCCPATVVLSRYAPGRPRSRACSGEVAAGDEARHPRARGDARRPADARPRRPAATAADWVLDGEKICVPAGLYADYFLVSATLSGGTDGGRLPRRRPTLPGVSREAQPTITYAPGIDPDALGRPGRRGRPHRPGRRQRARTSWCRVATAATCSAMVGVSAAAVKLTAEYTKTREQFGHPIALFQAVGQRAADAFIDAQAHPAHRAAGRLAAGPGAAGRHARWPSPSTSPPRPGSGSPARPSICTAAWASTATTRCTATTSGPSTSS